MQTATLAGVQNSALLTNLELTLVVSDPNVRSYLAPFEDEEIRSEKALEALKVGVIAIQSASPTLDTQVVQAKFAEVETRLREQMGDFQRKLTEELGRYLEDEDGVFPRSLDGIFGDNGRLGRTFQSFFDPSEGKLFRLMQAQLGPESQFGKALDPQNKLGVIALIEARVQELVQAKLDEVLQQFSLDEDGSAMFRLKAMLSEHFVQLTKSLGIQDATAAEAEKGHVKGMLFEEDLYQSFARLGCELGDDTELVRGTGGNVARCKKGDFVATLGETSGAPGQKIVVEVKDQPVRLKDANIELQEAKNNREAVCGIFVFARGCEPAEVSDFRRIGEDFYVTVDKEDLAANKPLLFLESAYKIARILAVAAARKEQAGELDLQMIHDQVDGLSAWVNRITDMATKARTIQNNGQTIEKCATELKQDLEDRVAVILKALQKATIPGVDNA